MQATITNGLRCHSVRFTRHKTDQSSFYLCCGYKGVGVNLYFVQRLVTSNMTEKNLNDRHFCRQLGQLTEVKFKKKKPGMYIGLPVCATAPAYVEMENNINRGPKEIYCTSASGIFSKKFFY